MKKVLFLCILLSCVLLSACGPTAPATPQVDYQSTITAYAVQNTTLNLNAQDLTKENDNLRVQLTELQTEIAALEEEIKTYQDLMYGTEEHYTPQVLCPDATKVEFSYADIDSMVEELKQFIAQERRDITTDQINSDYEQIWISVSDAIINLSYKDIFDPFLVTFEDKEYYIYNSLYSLTYQCYLDFPYVEQQLSTIRGK